MSQPWLLVQTLPTVVADAAETSPSPRRVSKPHSIFLTPEVAFPKEEDLGSVRFVTLHVANHPLFGSTFMGDAYQGRLLNL